MLIEGYWYWLGCKHPDREKLRLVWGYEAKRLGRELRSPDWNHSEDFQSKILESERLTLERYPVWWERLAQSRLPLAHYYVYGQKVVDVPEAGWILQELERLRLAYPRDMLKPNPTGEHRMPSPIPPPPPPPPQSPPSGGGRRMAIPPPPTAAGQRPAVHPGGLPAPTTETDAKRYWKDPNATPRDPNAPTPQSGPTPLTFADLPVGFEPRDGDVLVVHYGAVKVPLPAGKFGSIEVGGESYTRQLRAGDDVGEQYEKVYNFLKGRAERAASEKVKNWHSQFKGEG